jgi:hypothetical protein
MNYLNLMINTRLLSTMPVNILRETLKRSLYQLRKREKKAEKAAMAVPRVKKVELREKVLLLNIRKT